VHSNAVFAGHENGFSGVSKSCATEVPVISNKTIDQLRSAAFVNPVRAKTDIEAIDELLASLRSHSDLTDPMALRAAVLQRQKTDPPLLPMGIALPHARTDSVRSLVLAVGICPEPIDFGEMTVRLVLLIGVPKAAIAEYLDLTSFLVRHLRNPAVLDRLMTATNIAEFLGAFAEL
jgi:mannitol/fructose-specific phosphotransferase system IIA component (Ntr-type)